MKIDTISETIIDKVPLPERHALCDAADASIPASVLNGLAIELYMNENPDIKSMRVIKSGLQKRMDLFDTFIVFQALVERDLIRWDMSDYGPIPLERRPWYVRPRRKLMEGRA